MTDVTFRWKDYRHHGKVKAHDARRRRVHPPLPACTPCRTASIASATMASSPMATGPPSSRSAASCSRRRLQARLPQPGTGSASSGTPRPLPVLRRRDDPPRPRCRVGAPPPSLLGQLMTTRHSTSGLLDTGRRALRPKPHAASRTIAFMPAPERQQRHRSSPPRGSRNAPPSTIAAPNPPRRNILARSHIGVSDRAAHPLSP